MLLTKRCKLVRVIFIRGVRKMANDNRGSDNSWSLNRRSYLKRVSLGGLGIAGSGFLSNSVRGENTIKVPAYVSEGEVVGYTEVNKDWWDYTQVAKQVAEEAKDNFLNHPKVGMIEETSAEEELGKTGMLRDEVTVYAAPDASVTELRTIIPNSVDRININVRPWNGLHHTSYEGKHDPVPGGVVFGEGDDGNGGYDDRATICCRVDWSGKNRLLLPRHVFPQNAWGSEDVPGRCDDDDVTDKAVWQSDQYIGTTDGEWQYLDVAVVGRNTTASDVSGFSDGIINQVGSVEGYVDQSRLREIKSSYSDEVHKRGIYSEGTQGDVIGLNGTVSCDSWPQGQDIDEIVTTTNFQGSGDSGGPRYEEVEFEGSTYLYLIGPATQANKDYESLGSAAWYISQETGMSFT